MADNTESNTETKVDGKKVLESRVNGIEVAVQSGARVLLGKLARWSLRHFTIPVNDMNNILRKYGFAPWNPNSDWTAFKRAGKAMMTKRRPLWDKSAWGGSKHDAGAKWAVDIQKKMSKTLVAKLKIEFGEEMEFLDKYTSYLPGLGRALTLSLDNLDEDDAEDQEPLFGDKTRYDAIAETLKEMDEEADLAKFVGEERVPGIRELISEVSEAMPEDAESEEEEETPLPAGPERKIAFEDE
jgi:hypothetical protein